MKRVEPGKLPVSYEEEAEAEKEFLTKLDIGKHLLDVHGVLNEEVSNDFTMARLSDKDRDFVIEITGDAYFSRYIYDPLINYLIIKKTVWAKLYPNTRDGDCKVFDRQIKQIQKLKSKTFSSLMKKP